MSELPAPLALAFAAGVVLGALLTRRVGRALDGLRRRRRASRAGKGERRAVRLSRRAGYSVRGTQVRHRYTMWVDGRPVSVGLRADLSLVRRGRTVVAEAKTGRPADPTHDRTRRQLLEYAHAFGCDRVLLVDGESGRLSEVEFALCRRPRRWLIGFLAGVLVGGVLVAGGAMRPLQGSASVRPP